MARLTFVSVVFDLEHVLLELQARSMARFVPADLVEAILVIDNSAVAMTAAQRGLVLHEHGPLAGRVRFLRPEDICPVPATTGWMSQQVLKLAVAAHVTTDCYVVLDAKNHFVGPAPGALFLAADGRPRARVYSYAGHPLRPALEHALRYVGVDPAAHVERFTATVTPFVLSTALVRTMIADIERSSGQPFARTFVAHELTEFLLCSAWALAQGRTLDEVYELNEDSYPAVWPGTATAAGVHDAIDLATSSGSPVFSVHRTALARLDADAAAALAQLWTGAGLFASPADAHALIGRHVAAMRKASWRRRAREVSPRVRARVRRLVRRSPPGGRAGAS